MWCFAGSDFVCVCLGGENKRESGGERGNSTPATATHLQWKTDVREIQTPHIFIWGITVLKLVARLSISVSECCVV